jgi:hypothetical protein
MDTAAAIWFVLLIGMIPMQLRAAANAERRGGIRVAAAGEPIAGSRLRTRLVAGCAALLTLGAVSTACAGENAAAEQVIVDNLLTSLRAASADGRVSSRALIRRELAQLERHHGSRMRPGNSSDVE